MRSFKRKRYIVLSLFLYHVGYLSYLQPRLCLSYLFGTSTISGLKSHHVRQAFVGCTNHGGPFPLHPSRQFVDKLRRFHRRRQRQWSTRLIFATKSELYNGAAEDSSFDFSSKLGWDQYYQKASMKDGVEEWHASIPLETIASYCQPNLHACEILIIGCGTSRLADVLMEQHSLQRVHTRITLLDSSAACIAQLRRRYEDHAQAESLRFVCGDAVHLSSSLCNQDRPHSSSAQYDYIIDKGLMDALLCGDGWNTQVATLLSEVSSLLKDNPARSTYVLVSYRIPIATKEYLLDLSLKSGLRWDFECAGSNSRVGISVARKIVW